MNTFKHFFNGNNLKTNVTSIENIRNLDGNTFLHYCIKNKKEQILINLLGRTNIKFDINLKNNNGDTVLMLAIKHRMEDVAKQLLQRTDLNLKDNIGSIILMLAIEYGMEDVAKQLLNKPDLNINVNLQDNNGNSILMLAIDIGLQMIYIVEELLKRTDINVNLQDNDGKTALMISIIIYKDKNMFTDMLLQRTDIDVKLKNKNGDTVLDLCIKYKLSTYEAAITKILDPDYKKYNLPKFIDHINKMIRESANNSNINNNVYKAIIDYLKHNYKLISDYNNGQYRIESRKNNALSTILIIFGSNRDNFYKKIMVEYVNNIGLTAGINNGGITRNFFFECQQQLNELFKDFISNKINNRINNVITTRPSNNINLNFEKNGYYDKLQKDVDWKNYIIVVYLLFFSKINNCPIYLDKEFFGDLSIIILNLIIISVKYSLIQKIFIINMLQKYEDISKKKLHYGMYDLLLTERHRNNMTNIGKFNKEYMIATYIRDINKKIKNNRNAKNKEYMNKKMEELRNSISKNKNKKKICLLIDDAIDKGIYKDYIDFYYTHFIPDIITFEIFMQKLQFFNESSVNPNEFTDKIKKLLNYMNQKDHNNILLLAQAMSGNTLSAPTYQINMFKGNLLPVFHTCSNSVDFFENNLNYNITENEKENEKALKKFMDHIDLALKSNFVG